MLALVSMSTGYRHYAKVFAPFLDDTISWDLLFVSYNPNPFPLTLWQGLTLVHFLSST